MIMSEPMFACSGRRHVIPRSLMKSQVAGAHRSRLMMMLIIATRRPRMLPKADALGSYPEVVGL